MNKIPPLLTQLPPLKKGGQGGFPHWMEMRFGEDRRGRDFPFDKGAILLQFNGRPLSEGLLLLLFYF